MNVQQIIQQYLNAMSSYEPSFDGKVIKFTRYSLSIYLPGFQPPAGSTDFSVVLVDNQKSLVSLKHPNKLALFALRFREHINEFSAKVVGGFSDALPSILASDPQVLRLVVWNPEFASLLVGGDCSLEIERYSSSQLANEDTFQSSLNVTGSC